MSYNSNRHESGDFLLNQNWCANRRHRTCSSLTIRTQQSKQIQTLTKGGTMSRTYKHLNKLTKAELISIIKDSDNVINYLETQIKKAGAKIWN